MLQKTMFKKGENEGQHYYFFKNEVTKELVQIIKNKRESHWFGMYDNRREDRMFVIPVYNSEDSEEMLSKVCNWYNDGKPERIYNEPPEANPNRISSTLMEMKSMLGEFPLASAKRVQAYMDEPSIERWNDISGIIVNGWDTVWQLICEEDKTFPNSGPTIDITGKIISDWAKIPTTLEVLRAIKKGIKKKQKRAKAY